MKYLFSLIVSFTALYAYGEISVNHAFERMQTKLQQHKLLSLPQDCVSFTHSETASEHQFDVREIHNQKCGGIESSSPRIMTLYVNKQTGMVSTDNMAYCEKYQQQYFTQLEKKVGLPLADYIGVELIEVPDKRLLRLTKQDRDFITNDMNDCMAAKAYPLP